MGNFNNTSVRLAAMTGLAFMVSACANQSQTGEAAAVNRQSIYVSSMPDGASCELMREGKVIGTVEKTPDYVIIDRGKRPLMVVCKRDGYVDGAEVLAPRYTPSGSGGSVYVPNTAAGLAGGLIGLMMVSALEASMSRNYTYPSASVAMVENIFPTVEARDAAYVQIAAKLKEQAAQAQKASGGNCHPDDRDCQARPPEMARRRSRRPPTRAGR
jgi:hypothetical protein